MIEELEIKNKKISVVGLGKLGACIAATIAYKGFEVIGVDVNEEMVNKMNNSEPPVYEPGLKEMLIEVQNKISATNNIEEAIKDTDITFIITPTPSKENSRFSLKYVKSAIQGIGNALKNKDTYHLVVVISTIMPGSMDRKLIPLLEEISGKECCQDYGVCYSPTLIAIGTVIKNLLEPDLIILGEADEKSGELLQKFYRNYIQNDAPIFHMNLINAEISKIALNAYITTKISFVNTLAELCEKLPNADVDVVTDTIGSDPRIGKKYFKGGLSFGGPCFPRDTSAFAALLNQVNVESHQIEATEIQNKTVVERIVEIINKGITQVSSSDKVSIVIFGLTYKPGTVYVDDSPSIEIVKALLNKNTNIYVHDPIALEAAKDLLGDKVKYLKDIKAGIKLADVVVFTDLDPEYMEIDPSVFTQDTKRRVVVDIWRNFRYLKDYDGVYYIPIGKNFSQ
ncbi:MAG: nucleotide sugar dehydrogenase [Candidatus Heimdallarchaeota archaeon]